MNESNGQYKFDKIGHMHTLGGKPLMGVTTILSVINKPMLLQWSANMAVDYLKNIYSIGLELEEENFEEARIAHRIKKEKAGNWGTEVHEAIEHWIAGNEPTIKPDQQIVFDKFREWVKENNVKFLASEKHVWSEKLWTGGICDVVLEMDGKKYIGDFKTSNGIYNEAFFQIAAYHLMLIDMGIYTNDEIEGYIVINLKKDGKLDFKIATDKELNQSAFLAALSLYKIIQSLK